MEIRRFFFTRVMSLCLFHYRNFVRKSPTFFKRSLIRKLGRLLINMIWSCVLNGILVRQILQELYTFVYFTIEPLFRDDIILWYMEELFPFIFSLSNLVSCTCHKQNVGQWPCLWPLTTIKVFQVRDCNSLIIFFVLDIHGRILFRFAVLLFWFCNSDHIT